MADPPSSAGKGESMRGFVTAMVSAAAFACSGLTAGGALAQDKKAKESKQAVQKTVAENSKVKAFEVTYAPGAQNAAVPSSSTRVVRAIKGGTLERSYADGKKEKVEWKTGQVRVVEATKTAYTASNIGKSEIQLYVVQLK
jgi:hypothetical protein